MHIFWWLGWVLVLGGGTCHTEVETETGVLPKITEDLSILEDEDNGFENMGDDMMAGYDMEQLFEMLQTAGIDIAALSELVDNAANAGVDFNNAELGNEDYDADDMHDLDDDDDDDLGVDSEDDVETDWGAGDHDWEFLEESLNLKQPEIEKRMELLLRNFIDSDKDGLITRAEIGSWIGDLHRRMMNFTVDEEMTNLDQNGDGFVDFDEISTAMLKLGGSSERADSNLAPLWNNADSDEEALSNLRIRFDALDRNKDGKLDFDELGILFSLGSPQIIADVETEIIMKQHDSNKDDMLSFEEYLRFRNLLSDDEEMPHDELNSSEYHNNLNRLSDPSFLSSFASRDDQLPGFLTVDTDLLDELMDEREDLNKTEQALDLYFVLDKDSDGYVSRDELKQAVFDAAMPNQQSSEDNSIIQKLIDSSTEELYAASLGLESSPNQSLSVESILNDEVLRRWIMSVATDLGQVLVNPQKLGIVGLTNSEEERATHKLKDEL